MVRVIEIRNRRDLIKAANTIGRIRKRLPKTTRLGMQRWGKILVRDMKTSARQAFIMDSSGNLQGNGVRWEQSKRSNTGYLMMPQYAVQLDSMRPHWVSVKGSRQRLLAWSKKAIIPNIRTRARMVESGKIKSFGIYVKPHPFIQRGIARAVPKIRPVFKRAVARGVKV